MTFGFIMQSEEDETKYIKRLDVNGQPLYTDIKNAALVDHFSAQQLWHDHTPLAITSREEMDKIFGQQKYALSYLQLSGTVQEVPVPGDQLQWWTRLLNRLKFWR